MSLVLYSPSLLLSPLANSNGHHRQFLIPRCDTSHSSPIRRRYHLRSLSLPLQCIISRSESPRCCCSSSSSTSSSMPVAITNETSQLQESLLYSRAYWVSESIIAWNVDIGDGSCYLYASKVAALSVADNGLQGEDLKLQLVEDSQGLPENVVKKFPHIQDYRAFRLPSDLDIKSLLKCQLAVATFTSYGNCINATGLQLPGVLDELFSYDGPLGALFSEDISLYLWAPTAQAAHVIIYGDQLDGNPEEIVPLEEFNGVWNTKGPRSWEGCYYVYEVTVYHPSTLKIENCYANDPYARGLSSDGQRTLLVNLDSATLKPEGWDNLAAEKPNIRSFSDISIYELHVRDFSANDETVPPEFRGSYLAFTLQDSAGVLHLKKLSNAGITHIHLLPTFQFAGVDDRKENWKSVDTKLLEKLPPDSVEQQSLIMVVQNDDGYNWGYNPVLWGVPKGSYASNPDGPHRTFEFRKMFQALNHLGLRVVLDVVYNHLHGSGPFDENSILDKIVPGYYLRRNSDGFIEHSTCINNTASEHYMVERLILDDLLSWAVNYKVDGFRFDLMGHIMKNTMARAKSALHKLSKERDGVEGSSIYIYGEGWDFGEVAQNRRGVNASQFNLCGTGIGRGTRDSLAAKEFYHYLLLENDSIDYPYHSSLKRFTNEAHPRFINFFSFNDRIRDAMLGGSPFGYPLQQGFVTGLLLQKGYLGNLAFMQDDSHDKLAFGCKVFVNVSNPNGHEHGTENDQEVMLAVSKDHIQIGMAANLRDFVLTNHKGKEVKGFEVLTHDGTPVAYASCPTETINYVSAHDNETLFDIVSLKTPKELSVDERCRINHLATSLIAFSQGIPFFHSGDEILRSKSLDRDSYNSGDWFNRLDFTYGSSNWGVGLPPKEKNEKNWPLIKPRLADPCFKPQSTHILSAVKNFADVLRIRYSSPLFRLPTANAIQERVRFHNTGISWVPGVIVMSIEDGYQGVPGLSQLDPVYSYIVVIFNTCPTEVSFASPALRARALELHPVQLMSADDVVKGSSYIASSGCFNVPPRTTSVFVERREN